jgi:hypothetical protein
VIPPYKDLFGRIREPVARIPGSARGKRHRSYSSVRYARIYFQCMGFCGLCARMTDIFFRDRNGALANIRDM